MRPFLLILIFVFTSVRVAAADVWYGEVHSIPIVSQQNCTLVGTKLALCEHASLQVESFFRLSELIPRETSIEILRYGDCRANFSILARMQWDEEERTISVFNSGRVVVPHSQILHFEVENEWDDVALYGSNCEVTAQIQFNRIPYSKDETGILEFQTNTQARFNVHLRKIEALRHFWNAQEAIQTLLSVLTQNEPAVTEQDLNLLEELAFDSRLTETEKRALNSALATGRLTRRIEISEETRSRIVQISRVQFDPETLRSDLEDSIRDLEHGCRSYSNLRKVIMQDSGLEMEPIPACAQLSSEVVE